MKLKTIIAISLTKILLMGCSQVVVKPSLCSSFEKPLDLTEDEKQRLLEAKIRREWLLNVRNNKDIILTNCFKDV